MLSFGRSEETAALESASVNVDHVGRLACEAYIGDFLCAIAGMCLPVRARADDVTGRAVFLHGFEIVDLKLLEFQRFDNDVEVSDSERRSCNLEDVCA